eukprot:1746498-Rhodomonas_salina.2
MSGSASNGESPCSPPSVSPAPNILVTPQTNTQTPPQKKYTKTLSLVGGRGGGANMDVALVLVVGPRDVLGVDLEVEEVVDDPYLQVPPHKHHRALPHHTTFEIAVLVKRTVVGGG